MNIQQFKQHTINVVKSQSNEFQKMQTVSDIYCFENEIGNFILEVDKFSNYGYVDIIFPNFMSIEDNSLDADIFLFNRKYKSISIWKDDGNLWLSAHAIMIKDTDYSAQFHHEMMCLVASVITDIRNNLILAQSNSRLLN